MELCTSRAFSNFHHRAFFTPTSSNLLSWKTTSFRFGSSPIFRMSPGSLHCSLLRASIYEGQPSGAADQYIGGEGDGVLMMESVQETKEEKLSDEELLTEALKEDSEIVPTDEVLLTEALKEDSEIVPTDEVLLTEALKEDSQVDVQTLAFEFLDNLNIKFDSEDPYSVLLFGTGALAVLWFTSAIIGAVDSIPIFPKFLEIVGLGYTIWFSARYLIFKDSRDELAAKIEELKQQVLGSEDD